MRRAFDIVVAALICTFLGIGYVGVALAIALLAAFFAFGEGLRDGAKLVAEAWREFVQ